MGYKKICLPCRLCFTRLIDFGTGKIYPCPTCSNPMILLTHRFRAPKKSDDQKWKTVAFLLAHGFLYQPIFEVLNGQKTTKKVEYPENLTQARAFVLQYKDQAYYK